MWLSAKKARSIANSKLAKIMHKIEECAYKGMFEITLDYALCNEMIDILTKYGDYKVEYEKVPIYEESPYGIRYNIIGYKEQTTISWYEDIDNS